MAASNLTWDQGGLTPATPNAASGPWNLSSLYWSNGTTDVAWINANNDTASFGSAAAAYTVTLGDNVTVGGLTSANTNVVTIASGTGTTITLAGATPTISGSGSITFGNGVILQGSNGLTKSGTGQLRISTGATYTGNTTFSAGSFVAQVANALPVTTQLNISGAFTYFTSGNNQTLAGLSGVSSAIIRDHVAANCTLTITGGTNNYAGTLIDTSTGSTSLVNTGGTLTLSNAGNTYKGTTTVSGGTLVAGNNAPSAANGAFGNTATAIILGDAGTTTNNYSPSLLTGGAFAIGRAVTIANQATSGTYTIGGNTATSSSFTGLVTTNKNLSVTQLASGTLSITGGITGASAGTKTLTFANAGAVNVNTTGISDGATGNLAITQSGAGITTLNAANTYTGATTISAGTLALGASGTIDNSSGVNLGTSGSPGTLDVTSKASFGFGSTQSVTGYGTISAAAKR